MKKLISLFLSSLAMLLVSTTLLAGGPEPAPQMDPFSGFFLGGEAGTVTADYRTDSGVDYSLFNVSINSSENTRFGSTNGSLGLFAGWGEVLGRWYLGLEAQFNVGSVTNHVRDLFGGVYTDPFGPVVYVGGHMTDVSIDQTFGIYFRPGFLIDPHAMVFLLLGWGFANVHMDSRVGFLALNRLNLFPFQTASSHSWENGPSLGIGVQAMIRKHVTFWMAYKWMDITGTLRNSANYTILPPPFNKVSSFVNMFHTNIFLLQAGLAFQVTF